MKTIKLIILSILLPVISYGQTDTTYKIVGGKRVGTFYENTDSLIDKDDNLTYKDEIFYIKENEVLILYLYDNCKKCDVSLEFRTLTFTTRTDNYTFDEEVYSGNNTIPIDGYNIKKVIVRKPENIEKKKSG